LTGCFAQVGFGFAWREMSQNVFTQDLGPQVLGWQQHLSALLPLSVLPFLTHPLAISGCGSFELAEESGSG